MVADEFYQISVTLTAKLLNFSVEDSTYNKYKTCTGQILINDGQNAQLFPITAGSDMLEQLTGLVGKYITITGCVRNYRCNDIKYNVIRVYSAEEADESIVLNSVQAVCEVVGLMTKPGAHIEANVKAAQLYLLTNEKYNKHTRLNAVMFGTPDQPLTIDKLPTLGSICSIRGYLQLDKANQKIVHIENCKSTQALEGKLELVVTYIKEVNDDSRKSDNN